MYENAKICKTHSKQAALKYVTLLPHNCWTRPQGQLRQTNMSMHGNKLTVTTSRTKARSQWTNTISVYLLLPLCCPESWSPDWWNLQQKPSQLCWNTVLTVSLEEGILHLWNKEAQINLVSIPPAPEDPSVVCVSV